MGNLCGDKWAREIAIEAGRNGRRPSYQRRARPLQVSGVGNGSQACHFDCNLPVALRNADGRRTTLGELTIPSVHKSELPGLLGKTALKKNRAIWDFATDMLYFAGPGDYDLPRALPPGTDAYQLETAPSGHSVLPCCEYTSDAQHSDHSLTLVTRRSSSEEPRRGGPMPPPPNPPVLPATALRTEPLAPPPAGSPTTEQ